MAQSRSRTIIIAAIGLAFLAIAIFFGLFSSGGDLLSPYVPFKEAQSVSGRYVQVIGSLDRSVPVRHTEGAFTFTLIDKEGTRMTVIHHGTKPQNFEHTEQVVLLGRYRSETGLFEADKVLVKCPSKYRRQQ
jgi:cytochrome c-type biogenesis protein CcmE